MRATAFMAALMGVVFSGQAAFAAGKFDGVYEGEGMVRTGKCAQPVSPQYRVVDGHISHPFGAAKIEADIAPDGSITNANAAIRTMTTGSISGSKLSMDVTTPACTIHYELTKRS